MCHGNELLKKYIEFCAVWTSLRIFENKNRNQFHFNDFTSWRLVEDKNKILYDEKTLNFGQKCFFEKFCKLGPNLSRYEKNWFYQKKNFFVSVNFYVVGGGDFSI